MFFDKIKFFFKEKIKAKKAAKIEKKEPTNSIILSLKKKQKIDYGK